MFKTKKVGIYTLSAEDAKSKVRNWNKDKKNLKIISCDLRQSDDKYYEVTFMYEEAIKGKIEHDDDCASHRGFECDCGVFDA